MEEEDTDIACIQEPYILGNKIGGIPHSLTVLTFGERKKRAAIIINPFSASPPHHTYARSARLILRKLLVLIKIVLLTTNMKKDF